MGGITTKSGGPEGPPAPVPSPRRDEKGRRDQLPAGWVARPAALSGLPYLARFALVSGTGPFDTTDASPGVSAAACAGGVGEFCGIGLVLEPSGALGSCATAATGLAASAAAGAVGLAGMAC